MMKNIKLVLYFGVLAACVHSQPDTQVPSFADVQQLDAVMFAQYAGFKSEPKCSLALLGGYESPADEKLCNDAYTAATKRFSYELISCENDRPARYQVYYEITQPHICDISWKRADGTQGVDRAFFYVREDRLYLDELRETD